MKQSRPTSPPTLRAARALLHDDGAVAPDLLRMPVGRSWQRCLQSGLSPDRARDAVLVDGETLAQALARHAQLSAHARPVLDFVHEMIGGTGSLVVLADPDGLLLHARGDDSFVARAARVSLRPGASWAETTRGTNAIGTALAEGAPVVVHADEHFLADNGFLTCAAAPVFDSRGRILGVVDVSGDHRSRHPHTLALVRSAARMIEDRVFASAHDHDVQVHVHSRPQGLGGIGEGLLAFAVDGWLLGANGAARALLGLTAKDFAGCDADAVFGQSLAGLLAHVDRDRAVLLPSGARLWVRTRPPQPQRGRISVAAPGGNEDAQVRRAHERAHRGVSAGLTVLLQGESGTGKDVLARALHEQGPRRQGPFVALNCAALPEALIEAELFGYVGGSFTGARREGAPGHFRHAHTGTLFLDEIGDMPLGLQSRLLRVLEERRVTPIGAQDSVPVDVQVLAATHRDLRALVATGSFRADLYYRLAGLTVTLPPLRERSDFAALCAALLRELRPDRPTQLASEVAEAMRRYPWPGNLRQLRSALAVAVAMLESSDTLIALGHLPDDLAAELQAAATTSPHDLRTLSDRAIAGAIAASDGNMSAAARRLGISRNTLYRRLRRSPD